MQTFVRFFMILCLVTCVATVGAQDKKPASPKQNAKQADKPKAEPAAKKADAKKETTKKPAAKKEDKKKEDKPKEVAKTVVRQINIAGSYVDLVQPAGLDPLSLLGGSVKQRSFFKLLNFIDEAAKDDKHDVIVLNLAASISMNSAQLDELSRHFAKLGAAGKKTYAWLENAERIHVEIASMCDKVYLADFGGIDMPSSSMESIFYRDAMDLVGIKASVVRAGDFKGAVEPYLNSKMSDHLREHYLAMLTSINDAAVERIARGRGLQTAKVREMQKQRMYLPKEALAAGLVDKLAPYGSMQKSIEQDINQPVDWITAKKAAKKSMSFFQLMGELMAGNNGSGQLRDNTVVVLHLSGAIVDGTANSAGSIVSGPTVERIEKLVQDEKVKGVVVRVNSPGGSATASEAIRQALKKLAETKPTVISMGDVAASGGYWISCIDTPIYAERGTVTGSIGVFSMKFSGGALMRRVGLHVENILLDESAGAFAMNRPFSESDTKTMQKSIDMVYGRFLSLVSKSRKIPVPRLQKLAGGRVWSGSQALRNKLVDQLGGVDDCIHLIAKKAGLGDKYQVSHRPVAKGGLDLSGLLGNEDSDIISTGDLAPLSVSTIKLLKQRGVNFQLINMLISDSLKHQRKPTAWLMSPVELSIR